MTLDDVGVFQLVGFIWKLTAALFLAAIPIAVFGGMFLIMLTSLRH